ncbi:unnamed protein product, partial [Ectocarpus sp. 6 AP-2014]
ASREIRAVLTVHQRRLRPKQDRRPPISDKGWCHDRVQSRNSMANRDRRRGLLHPPVLFPPAVGGYTLPVSPRHPAAGEQTENPPSPPAARGYEEGTQRRENVGGAVQTPRAS